MEYTELELVNQKPEVHHHVHKSKEQTLQENIQTLQKKLIQQVREADFGKGGGDVSLYNLMANGAAQPKVQIQKETDIKRFNLRQ